MTARLLFTDHARTAAQHLLDHTTLGRRVTTDTDHAALVVTATEAQVGSLSTGERALWDTLAALSWGRTVNLARLARELDDGAYDAVIVALFMLRGRMLAVVA